MKTFGLGLACVAGAGVVAYMFIAALSIPDVWVSYSSRECVKVINYVEGDNFSCENLPSKFNHVWVQ